MGFWHEQSRPDRDHHVKIVWENINKGNRASFDVNEQFGSLCKLQHINPITSGLFRS